MFRYHAATIGLDLFDRNGLVGFVLKSKQMGIVPLLLRIDQADEPSGFVAADTRNDNGRIPRFLIGRPGAATHERQKGDQNSQRRGAVASKLR
jgi:hypothetical protein